ncbi:MAG: hypothetical protein OEU91_08440 [Gammaproteobacteria bacterium]|nr:hypothetical protein [Gammaproteobacteria bacterium]
MSELATDPFRTAFRGRFENVLRWQQLDALWDVLDVNADGQWYIYAVGEQPPTDPASATAVRQFLTEIAKLLRKEHAEDYCGVVFTDSMDNPAFVKIFDPNNLGVSCGYSDNPPLPGWILSKLTPVDLNATTPLPGNRRRWWQRLARR